MSRLAVVKTVKLYINGAFPRTESGRTYPVYEKGTKKLFGHLCQASRKDARAAVDAAKGALGGWSGRSAYNRGQILYRMAEMMEGKRDEFVSVMTRTLGWKDEAAESQVDRAIDAFVYYAGFTDKYQQVYASVNPVAGPHHNFTTPEPVGVVAHFCHEKFDLEAIVAQISSVICSGNTLITLLPKDGGAILAPLAEVFATSDLPNGVVNLLTGDLEELYKPIGQHMEIQSLNIQFQNETLLGELRGFGVENMKRVHGPSKETLGLRNILNFIEYKTVWHPIGQ